MFSCEWLLQGKHMSQFNLVKILASVALALQLAIIAYIYVPLSSDSIFRFAIAGSIFSATAISVPCYFVVRDILSLPRIMLIVSLAIMTLVIFLAPEARPEARLAAASASAISAGLCSWYFQRRILLRAKIKEQKVETKEAEIQKSEVRDGEKQ